MAKSKDPLALLAAHADGRDTLKFSETILHGRIRFEAGSVVRFTDPAAAAYFDVAFNGTEFTDEGPTRRRTITNEEINFDPDDPSGNETIDPHTKIGDGREGVKAGTTVHQALTGEGPTADGALEPHDVVGTSNV